MLDENSKRDALAQLGDVLGERMGATSAKLEKPSAVAVGFLKRLDPFGRHNLVAIDPNGAGRLEGRTFEPGDWPAMAQWIDAREGRSNLYYSVNEPIAGASHSKLTKSDIAAVRAYHVDIDPKGGRDEFASERSSILRRLEGSSPAPSLVVDSGGGFNALWKLERLLQGAEDKEQAELQNAAVSRVLGGDTGTHNIDRILRLPGTRNLPNAKKREKGREVAKARLLPSCDASYSTNALAAAYPAHAAPLDPAAKVGREGEIRCLQASLDMYRVMTADTFEGLPDELRTRFERLCQNDLALCKLWRAGEEDRSSGRFRLAQALKNAGEFEPEDYGALLWVWPHAIGQQEEVEAKITAREISRAWINASSLEERHQAEIARWFDPSAYLYASETEGEAAPIAPKPSRFLSMAEICAKGLEGGAPPLIKGLLDQGALSVCYGESNVGKTFVAMDMAYHVATGRSWAGLHSYKMPVAFIAAEGGRGAKRRLHALKMKYRKDAEIFLLPAPVNFRDPKDMDLLIGEIRELPALGMIVVDTLSRAMGGGDENASTDMGALVKSADRLRAETGAHVMFIHHSGKDLAKGARGHSLLRAALDTEIEISSGTITVTKQRDMDGGFQRHFKLVQVLLGEDLDSDIVTSCVLEIISKEQLPSVEPTVVERETLEAILALVAETGREFFNVKDIAGKLKTGEGAIKSETVRTRLRALEKKRLISKCASKWGVKSGEIGSTASLKSNSQI